MGHSTNSPSFFLLFVLCVGLTVPSLCLEIEVIIDSHVTCFGGSDGVAHVNITDGVPPFKYLWPSTSDNTPIAKRLAAGDHNVSVKDANSVVTRRFTVLQPAPLAGEPFTYSYLASCDSGGAISALAHGGTPPYTYNWVASSIHTEIVLMAANTPTLIFDEYLRPEFTLVNETTTVDMQSGYIEAYSGIWSMRVETIKPQKISFACSTENTNCIDTTKYRGFQFWRWKENSNGKISVGVLDSNGGVVDNGITDFGFDESTWTMGFMPFDTLPGTSYTGIFVATNDAFTFHLDDIVLLPLDAGFSHVNNISAPLILPIFTPSAIYGPVGEYSVRISDYNECSVLMNLDVDAVPDLRASVSVDLQTVTVKTTGGTSPFTFNITSPNITSNTNGIFNYVPPGNYTIYVVDSRTCVYSIDMNVSPVPINPPIDPPGLIYFSKYKVANAFLIVLAGLCALSTILFSILAHKRKNDLRPHSLLFCQTILIGAFLGYIAAILAVIDVSWARCIGFSWTVDFSVTVIYGSMFAKSMQILKILDNFTKFVSIDTTDRYMSKVFCFIIVPELIILTLWSGLAGTVLQHTMTAGKGEVIFWIVFLIYKGVVGFLASFICFRMRYKFKEYAEIQQIAYCHFALEVVLVFMVVFTLIAREKYNELFVAVQSFSVSAIVSIPIYVIFKPILSRAYREYKEEKKTRKWHKLSTNT